MIDKTESCALCGVEICFACGVEGISKLFCSDECAEAYAATKTPVPCPFCGHAAKIVNYLALYDVKCGNRDCLVSPHLTPLAKGKIAAIVRWNTRVDV